MSNIKISVIVPVYNTSKFLEKCIRSIMIQSFRDIEIICINDGSTDNSLEILKRLKLEDKRIIIINKENEGLSSTRNYGIEIARGEYILHIDSDDWIEQNYFKEMYEKAKIDNADIVVSDFYYYNNKKIKYIVDNENNKDKLKIIKNICYGKGHPNVWNKLIRTELYKKNNILHPKGISLGEDLFVILKLFYYSQKITKVEKAFYNYIKNPISITKSKNNGFNKLKDIYFVVNDLEKFFQLHNLDIPIIELKVNHLGTWLFNMKYNLKNEEYKKILKEYLKLLKEYNLKFIKTKKKYLFMLVLKEFNYIFVFVLLWYIFNLYVKFKERVE